MIHSLQTSSFNYSTWQHSSPKLAHHLQDRGPSLLASGRGPRQHLQPGTQQAALITWSWVWVKALCSNTCWTTCPVVHHHHYREHLDWSDLRRGSLLSLFCVNCCISWLDSRSWLLYGPLPSTGWKAAWPSIFRGQLQRLLTLLGGQQLTLLLQSS